MSTDLKIGIIIYFLIIIEYCIASMLIGIKLRRTVKVKSLLTACVFSILWMFTVIIEKFFAGTDYFIYIIRLPIIFAQLSSTAVLIYVLFHLEILKYKNRWLSLLFYVPRLICFLPYFTNKYFYLVIEEFVNNSTIIKWGPILNIGKLMSYLYIALALILLIIDATKKKKYYLNNFLVILAVGLPLCIHLLTEAKIIHINEIDYSPMVFSAVIIFYTLSIFKFRTDDVINKATYELFNYTSAGVMIINKSGQVVEYNNSFKKLFNNIEIIKRKTSIIKTINEIFKNGKCNDSIEEIENDLNDRVEGFKRHIVKLEENDNVKTYYSFDLINLFQNENKYSGKLIIINDITKQRESNITEERRRLSDDLHDSLGNSINVISLNLEFIISKLEQKNHKEILECREIWESASVSYSRSTNAFLELRRIIDGLYPIDIENNGIIWALESLFRKTRIKGIEIEFVYSNIDDELINKGQISGCLYSICQEAMSNSIMNGLAKEIFVSLKQCGKEFVLNIIDDGVGCKNVIANKGISGMEKRVKDLNGEINYGQIGEDGFFVKITIPIG